MSYTVKRNNQYQDQIIYINDKHLDFSQYLYCKIKNFSYKIQKEPIQDEKYIKLDKSILDTLKIAETTQILTKITFGTVLDVQQQKCKIEIDIQKRKKLNGKEIKDSYIRSKDLIKKQLLNECQSLILQKGKIFYTSDQCIQFHVLKCNENSYIQQDDEISFTSDQIKFSETISLINFQEIYKEIGGLDKQLKIIYEKIFFSRQLPSNIIEKYNIQHIKGFILYGEPGCGKSLIGRQIAKLLNAKEINVINGPQLICQYVGQSEKNIRELFKNAIESKTQGDLYVYIFDEFDAVSRNRGGGNQTQIYDNIVNQLLTIIDGIYQNDNILIIALTNRIDLIDKAILRAGRLEIQIQIDKPDLIGIQNIYDIYLQKIKEENWQIDMQQISEFSFKQGFTGSDIKSVINQTIMEALLKQQEKQIQICTEDILEQIKIHCQMKRNDKQFDRQVTFDQIQGGKIYLIKKKHLVQFQRQISIQMRHISAYQYIQDKCNINLLEMMEFKLYIFDDADLYIEKIDKKDQEFRNVFILFNHFQKINKELNVILCGNWEQHNGFQYINDK